MTSERRQKIEEIFQTVVDCNPDERTATLTQICEGDDELRREVERLLAEDDYATRGYETFVGEPAEGVEHIRAPRSYRSLIGTSLGPYRITEQVGSGGMGAVYAAVRDDQLFKQHVAIKVVRRGMDTRFILQRFGQERRMLAGLNHPNIARMIDGGATEDGLPYFVMEYVEGGNSITHYCAERRLSIPDRLRLFRQVCGAVQYAHQKLIVHRDIKPKNILVNREGMPKLVDFGIAKLLDSSQSSEVVTKTATAMRLMTPDYASPEQVLGLAITTATDVYSLGAVLYEMLTGQRPHRLQRYTPTEIERVICETEVARPSEALGERLGETARRTAGIPAKAHRQLAVDLDNIVLMAMRKEPERRYQSVEHFSDDLRRHLEGLPVVARGDSIGYRAGKFLRRHKVLAAAAALVIISLLAGVVVANYQARRAERRFQQVRRLANTFLFDFHDGIKNLPGSTQIRERMSKTAVEYLDSLAQESEGDPELLLELAQAYLKVGDVQGDPWAPNLGHSAEAMQSYRKALGLAERSREDGAAGIAALRVLATAYGKLGMLLAEAGDKRGAQEILNQGERVATTVAQQTGEHQDLDLVESLSSQVGQVQLDTGNVSSALQSFTRSLEWAKRVATLFPGDEIQAKLATNHGQIGEVLGASGDLPGALENYRQAAAIAESLIKNQPNNMQFRRGLRASYSWIGAYLGNPNYVNAGDLAGSEAYSRKALTLAAELAAQDRKNVLAQSDLAVSHARLGDVLINSAPTQALEHYRQGLAVIKELLTVAPQEFRIKLRHAICLTKLGGQLCRMGRCREGVERLTAASDALQSLAAQDTANMQLQLDLHLNLYTLGEALLQSGDRDGALTAYRGSLAAAEKAGAASPQDQHARLRLIQSYEGLGRYYATLGADQKIPRDEQLGHRRAACDWRRKALNFWVDWSNRVATSNFGATRREQAARAVAGCF
ncbi:MAG: protein kinase [Acidobacteria bacterium]|nr:protein kinase [Acidobacteriota bacterium]